MLASLVVVPFLAACQPSAEQLWDKAQAAAQDGEYSEASIYLKNLLRRNPDDARARAALGAAALAMGDPESAEKELRRAIALGASSADTQFVLIEALLAQGHFQDALVEVAPAADAPAADPRALMLSGRAHEGLGQLPEAEADYRKANAAEPGETEPLVALAAVALRTDRGSEADVFIEKALLLDPNAVPALILKGRRIMQARGGKDAEAFFRDALGRAKTPAEKSQVLGDLAVVQLVTEDLKGATESVEQLEGIAPSDISTRYLRARVQAQAGDYPTAILGLQRIMNDSPGFLPAERLLGTVHYLNGNLEQAAMHISRVIEEGGNDPFLGRLLAELRLQQSRPEQALQTLLPMIRQGPGAAFEQGMLALAGQASLSLGDSASALDYFRRGSEQYPDDERFRLGEISARLASGDAATARTMLEGMRASSSNPLAVDYLSVMTYLVERDNAKAETLATRLASENADAPWAHLLLATVYVVVGRNADARQQFDMVLNLDPVNKEALINLARLDYQDGDPRAGENRLLRVIEAHPEDYRPRLLLAEAQLSERRFNEAVEQARQVARLAPDMPAALNLLGRAAAAAGRWGEARDSFNRITTLDPGNARAWLNLARASVAASKSGTLPDSLTKAMDIAPRDPAVLVTAGDLLMELRQPGEAAKYFERAYTISPGGEIAIRHCRARMATSAGSSCSLLTSWLARNPQDIATRLFQASVHQARGETKQAVSDYEAVLVGDARQAVALNNLAWLYFMAGDARALGMAERALQAQPESAPAMDTLGWIQVKQGDTRRGLELITAAARLLPKDPEIQYHLAFALAENGQKDQARKTIEAALQVAPQFPSRADAEKLMRSLDGPDRGAGS